MRRRTPTIKHILLSRPSTIQQFCFLSLLVDNKYSFARFYNVTEVMCNMYVLVHIYCKNCL